jgi:AcrR family transcriptional regulator
VSTASDLDIARFPHGRVPRAVRREQLVTLAQQLFAERGFEGVSMEELARRAGITKPVVYGIFGSKDGLYRACIDRAAERLAAVVTTAAQAGSDPVEQLRAGGTAFFRFAAEHRGAWEMLYEGGGRFADARNEIRARQDALVVALLRDAAAALGGDVPEQRLQAAATMLNGAYESLVTFSFANPDVTPETLADWVVALMGPGLLASAAEQTPKEHTA